MKEIDLSIIILNFNTKELLRECLYSLQKTPKSKLGVEVVVADNGSIDHSLEMVKKEFPQVARVDNKHNLGFAAGNNRAISKTNGRYVLFLNSDTVVPKDTLEYMVNFMDENKDVGVSTCKIVLAKGGLDWDSHRGFPTPWNSFCYFSGLAKIFPESSLFNGYHLGHLNLDKNHEIDACVGAFLLVRREVGKKIGWWDEDYFFYGEDLEFCFQVKKLGWKIMYVPQVSITHYKGASSGIRKESQEVSKATKETRKKVAKASIDAMRIFYKKHYYHQYPKLLSWVIFRVFDLKYQLRLRGIK